MPVKLDMPVDDRLACRLAPDGRPVHQPLGLDQHAVHVERVPRADAQVARRLPRSERAREDAHWLHRARIRMHPEVDPVVTEPLDLGETLPEQRHHFVALAQRFNRHLALPRQDPRPCRVAHRRLTCC